MSKSRLRRNHFGVACRTATSLIALLLAFIMGASLNRHIILGGEGVPKAIRPIVEKLSTLPSLIKQASLELNDVITGKPSALLIPKNKTINEGWVHKFPAPDDDGYLLLSGLSAQENQSIVQLIRVADGKVIAKWVPNWIHIHSHITGSKFGPKGNTTNYRAIHPLLLNDASIIFNTSNSLVRLPLCSSTPSWILDYPYHHSIEFSPASNSVWVSSVTEAFSTSNDILIDKLRDDSLSEVTLDGRVLQNISFSKILNQNHLTANMLGSTGFTTNFDPLHINQITPATSSSSFWQRGDLLISARHTSTIYLYRPSTGKIIWHQQGPWLNQHSAHFKNGDSITVFGNDVYGNKLTSPFMYKEGHNKIYKYDFITGESNTIHSEAIINIKPKTISEGRLRVLDDNSLFIEETNNARLIKLNSEGDLIWSYINVYDQEHLGLISWSRYITRKELHELVNYDQFNCNIK